MLESMLGRFLRYQLLFWMEVLNLKDEIGHAAATLLQALNFLPAADAQTELHTIIQDSRNFITAYAASPVSQSTPHIYISALPLLNSAQSSIRQMYCPRMSGLVHVEGTAIKDRGNAALATWATGSPVLILALSKDGRRIVSGAGDGTVSVWDTGKGIRLLGPLPKHTNEVYAVAFSPDGTRIASGTHDPEIQLRTNSFLRTRVLYLLVCISPNVQYIDM
ncbi:unnamed protein product [Rhizoctonia solani]|uniref:Vegetative incompatibility protein HET-E-1 [Podospora anserina] n=1 Tax=Rhizoctonia solani TaxID=456999 RepID=A0A8H3CCK8_9AGAM|nr:unnamed protein product [Rhizoctonia solani]